MAGPKYSSYNNPDHPLSPMEVWVARAMRYRLLWILMISIFLLDQFTKVWIASLLPLGAYHPPHRINILEGYLHLVHVANSGAAWGILQGWTWLLAAFSALCVVLIFLFRETLQMQRTPCQLAFGFLLGGVLGNLLDRVFRGHVIDFIDVHIGNLYVWPAFNVADAGIFCGVAIYLYYTFFMEHRYPPPRKKVADFHQK